MNKQDFNKKMIEIKDSLPQGTKLLLHSCCGPCSSRCIEALKDKFQITVYFFNPNITDKAEYEKRKSEQIRFLNETGWADFLDCDYDPQVFFDAVQGMEQEKEGGARCYLCYALRQEETAKEALKQGYSWFCSTLSVSPHKNSQWLNELGEKIAEKYGINWLYSDFKKQNGYLRSVELAQKYNLYRQNYCGCVFSDWTKELHNEK